MTGPHASPSPPEEPSDTVVVGIVAGTHGYDGRVRVQPDTDNPKRFARGSRILISDAPYTVERVTTSADGLLIVKLRGLTDREEAAKLRGEPVLVRASDLPELPEGTYYHHQLIDMTVVDTAGNELGKLTEVLSTGANDVYVVTAADSEVLIPALADVVVEVDVGNARMTVDVPEGIEARSTVPTPKRKPPRRHRRPAAGKPPASS